MNKLQISSELAQIILPKNKVYLQASLDALNEKKSKLSDKDRKKLLIASASNPELALAIASARVETITNNLWAKNYALGFAERKPLDPGDWAEIVNKTSHGYSVLVTAVHGEAPRNEYNPAYETLRLHPEKYSTGIIQYPAYGPMIGNLDLSAEVDEDVERSAEQTMNTKLYGLIDAAIDTFPAGSLVADSRIVAGTLPSTNDLSATSEDSITYNIFKEIVLHCTLLGKQLSFLVINPRDIEGIWDWQHLVSTTSSGSQDAREVITTRIKDEILETGRIGQLLGQQFTIITDPIRERKSITFFTKEAAVSLYDIPAKARTQYYDEDQMEALGKGEEFEGLKLTQWWIAAVLDKQRLNFGNIAFKS